MPRHSLIQIEAPTFMLLSKSGIYMTGAAVTMVRQANQLHFVIQSTCDDEPTSPGNEAGMCISVLRAFKKKCIGHLIQEVNFSAYYAGEWKRISFESFSAEKIGPAWPEYDRGEALGPALAKKITKKEGWGHITDDSSSDLFSYWHASFKAKQYLEKLHEEHIRNFAVSRERKIPCGSTAYEVTDRIKPHFFYAVDRSVLLRRRRSGESRLGEILYRSPVQPFNVGFGCMLIGVTETNDHYRKCEPGKYILPVHEFDEWTHKMRFAGADVTVEGSITRVDLPADINLTHYLEAFGYSSCTVLRRGRYLLSVEDYQ